MDFYVLDTNIYVEAFRDRNSLRELKEFLTRAGTRVRFEGIVAAELFAGAISDEHLDAVRQLVAPYRSREWTIAPSFVACAEAGRAIGALRTASARGRRAISPSLMRDAMIASSCREAGAVLITRNAADFRGIQRHLRGFRFLPPWPLSGRRV